ncbi:MAG: hypothetical protein ACRD7E_26360 [Bryobacteraceae bacterium]
MNPNQDAAIGQLDRFRRNALIIGIVASAASVIGAFVAPQQFFFSYLVGYLLWTGVALGSISLLMIHHMTGGNWGFVARPLFECGSKMLVLMAVLILPVLLGIPYLYIWSNPEHVVGHHLLEHKARYLNVTFFLIRTAIYFLIWLVLVYLLNRRAAGVPVRMKNVAGPGLVIHGLVITFAMIDWAMSLEPEWYSTIFGMIFMVGQLLSAIAFMIIILAIVWDRITLAGIVLPDHYHDLGNLMLTFVMLWAYTSFSQYLIIWSGNLPEETPWYIHRMSGGWQWLALALVLFHFSLPFLLLLTRYVKRRARMLAALAGAMIFMRLVDLVWVVSPALHTERLFVHWLDIIVPVGMGGLWVAIFMWQLKRRTLEPAPVPAARVH